jgi:hypothetical protein
MENTRENQDQFVIEKSEASFDAWLTKSCISDQLRQQLSKSNVLLLPQEDFRQGTGITFPLGTDEFFRYLRENAPEDIKVDILIEDSDYKEIALFSDLLIILGSFFVTSIVAPIFVNLVSDYLIKKKLPRKTINQVRIEILIEGDQGTTRVFYEGSISDFYKTVYPVVESLVDFQPTKLNTLPPDSNE